jgi:hypothetical protein
MSNRNDFNAIERSASPAPSVAALILGGLLLLTRP